MADLPLAVDVGLVPHLDGVDFARRNEQFYQDYQAGNLDIDAYLRKRPRPRLQTAWVVDRAPYLRLFEDAAGKAANSLRKQVVSLEGEVSKMTEAVAEHMRRAETEVFVHHSAVSREERQLAEERFHWPKLEDELMVLTGEQINWLLDGYNISQMKPHKILQYESLC